MEIVVDLLMGLDGFGSGGLWRGDFGETLGQNGIGFPIGVRVLVVGELAFHDEGGALFQLVHDRPGQFVGRLDRYWYGLVVSSALIGSIVEREDGCEGRLAGFLFNGARIIRRAEAEFDLVHWVFMGG